jgi:glycosyltransferase involved in cell wall biosynthesis
VLRKPLISVLTPAYNAASFLPELIRSVRSQDYQDFEHVIIDDGSNDAGATRTVLHQFDHLRWWSRENRGQYATQNELLSASRGDIVTFISADDFYVDRHVLTRVAEAFASTQELDVLIGRTPRLVTRNATSYTFDPDLPCRMAARSVRYCLSIQHCSVFASAPFVKSANLQFDTSFSMRGDWDWIIRLLAAARRLHFSQAALGCWRLHENQTSQRQVAIGRSESIRLCSKHNTNLMAHNTCEALVHGYGLVANALAVANVLGCHSAAAATARWLKRWALRT